MSDIAKGLNLEKGMRVKQVADLGPSVGKESGGPAIRKKVPSIGKIKHPDLSIGKS